MIRSLSVLSAGVLVAGLMGCETFEGDDDVSVVMTQEAQAAMTPAAALEDLKAGNARFVEDESSEFDYLAQAEATASGQYPKAVVLSCLDSRVPVEAVFDQGIGDLFVARVAGNIENVDILGSMEFATELAGTPLIVVLGHSSCGAVKGAIAEAKMGNLTALLGEITPAIKATEIEGDHSVENTAYVDAVVEANVRKTMQDLPARSEVLKQRARMGKLMIVGGVYDLATGQVHWLD
ncbi:MAG: carbonic anhydrase family protein [Phycisphaeraceae bacterium]